VIPTTSVSRPQLKSNPIGDRVMRNSSQGKKQEVEDPRRSIKLSKNKTSVTACNDSLNAKTLNVNSICATCDKCVLHDKHDMCVLTSAAKPIKRTVASESNQKPRNITRKLYERLVVIVLFIVDSGCSKHMTGNLKLLINFVEKFLGTVKFGNDQIAPIIGYGNLVQGAVTIKRVYYVEGLNHNLFFVGQFCYTDLEVAFWKSTCFLHDLKGNDLLTGSRGTNLYSITLQDINFPNPICLMAKATSSQAWLWHRRLSHLNFDTINLLSKNDIVVGLPKLKFVKDHLCSYYELGKAKRKLVQRGLQAQVRVVRTDKGTKFLNQTLHAYFAAEGILHQTPMFDELLNGSSNVVSKSSAVCSDDAPNQRQHYTTPLNNHTTPAPTCQVPSLAPTVTSFENINQVETYAENDQVADDEFINIFCTPVQNQGETSSRHEAMADSAWIESMQEEL
nr:integrase, catalytic region, zinc finger, CCHC-type, peptidase aspartic, catalytic [Tanacetum cinerariifolium]